MEERYQRNIPALTPAEQTRLAQQRVLVLGCGGLGGYILEQLARLGVGQLTLADGDRFEPDNLNRQLLCTARTLGRSKAEAAAARLAEVNPRVAVRAIPEFFTAENAGALVAGQSLVMDALDSVPARLLLEQVCAGLGVPLVHGAVQGWNAQIAVVPPGSGLLRRLYGGRGEREAEKSCLACTPALCAALQCAEAVKLLCGRPVPLEGRLLLADLQCMEFTALDL